MTALLTKLRGLRKRTDDGTFSTADVADAMGCAAPKARKLLAEAIAEGTVEPVRVRKPDMRGVMMWVWAYRLTEKRRRA